MGKAIPDIIKEAARNLRKDMTTSEKILWNELRSKKIGHRIIRQSPIYVFTEDSGLDRYIIADFYCPEKNLIIEIDGCIHDAEEIYLLDREKEKLLIQAGYKIIRFQNTDVQKDIHSVIAEIKNFRL